MDMALTSILKRLFLVGFMTFHLFFVSGLSIHAQGVKSITRQMFLQMDERHQAEHIRLYPSFVILDLITTDWIQRLSEPEGRFFISVIDFESLPVAKKLHILRNEQNYVIVPEVSDLPVVEAGGNDFRNMSESEIAAYMKNKK
jgi:hypothetical protein